MLIVRTEVCVTSVSGCCYMPCIIWKLSWIFNRVTSCEFDCSTPWFLLSWLSWRTQHRFPLAFIDNLSIHKWSIIESYVDCLVDLSWDQSIFPRLFPPHLLHSSHYSKLSSIPSRQSTFWLPLPWHSPVPTFVLILRFYRICCAECWKKSAATLTIAPAWKRSWIRSLMTLTSIGWSTRGCIFEIL